MLPKSALSPCGKRGFNKLNGAQAAGKAQEVANIDIPGRGCQDNHDFFGGALPRPLPGSMTLPGNALCDTMGATPIALLLRRNETTIS